MNEKNAENKEPDRIKFGDHVILYRRGNRGIWTADYHYFDRTGRRQHGRKSFRTRNRRVAEQKATELEKKLAAGESLEVVVAVVTKVTVAIEGFISSKETDGRSSKTIVKYRGELENFRDFLAELGVTTLQQITISMADAYKAHRKDVDKLEPYTIHNHLIILKSWLAWAKKRKLVAENPLSELEIRTPRRRRHAAATHEQVEAILSHAFEVVFVAVMMLAFAGLRIGELIALRPQDVDLEMGIISVTSKDGWDTKTASSQRSVPIHRRLLAVLRAMKRTKSKWFFSSAPSARFPLGDHHLNPREVNVVFQKLAKNAGLSVGRKAERGLTLHALRRYFKTYALDNGVPKPMVDFWMGHRDQNDMDSFYYDPIKSQEWMKKMPFGEPSEQDLIRMKTKGPKGERL